MGRGKVGRGGGKTKNKIKEGVCGYVGTQKIVSVLYCEKFLKFRNERKKIKRNDSLEPKWLRYGAVPSQISYSGQRARTRTIDYSKVADTNIYDPGTMEDAIS